LTKIFLFSNTGGKEINEIAQKYHLDSIKRDTYDVTIFQRALANAAFNEPGFLTFSNFLFNKFSFPLGGLWHASLINRHLVTFFVPFLPLERSHIRTCIRRQLELSNEDDEQKYKISDNDIVDRVLDLIEFAPPDSLLYSVSGCKKVQQKLDYVLEGNRIIPPEPKQDF
jgi:hypothetical protein